MYGLCLLGVMTSLSCAANASSSEQPPATSESQIDNSVCEPLTGSYRIAYAKERGDCAELPEQVAYFALDGDTSALSSQCQGTIETSENGCERTEDCSSPVADASGAIEGEAHMVALFSQVGAGRAEGTVTITLQTTLGVSCSATYALLATPAD
jgi:hypothetical protein